MSPGVRSGDVVLLHGAGGAVGTSALQQAGLLGATVIGTAGKADFDAVARFGGVPVEYGPGLESGSVRLPPARSAPRWTRSAPTKRSTSPWRWLPTASGL